MGFYTYSGHEGRYRTDLGLEFVKGTITGEGSDDVGPFVVRGRYHVRSRECHWTKSYVGKHDVYYRGFREGRGIWGTWEIWDSTSGGFKIWPLASGEGDAETEENTESVEAVSTQEYL